VRFLLDALATTRFSTRFRELFVVVLISAVSAVATTSIIGDLTVYAPENDEKRRQMHAAMLENVPPEGKTWDDVGANNLNVRVAIVLLADGISNLTGQHVDFVYRAIDLSCLFAALLLIYHLLKTRFVPFIAFGGLLLTCTLLPLTMLDHYFHPWDRPMLLLWAAMIWATTQNRLFVFGLLYALAVAIKLDALMAVGMVWFARVKLDDWLRPTLETTALALVGATVLFVLLTLFPGGQEHIDIARQLGRNFEVAQSYGIAYPPLLVHGLLGIFGALGWSSAQPLLKRFWLFGLVMLLPHLLLTNFVEVRAQVGTLLCMLPLAMHGIHAASSSTRTLAPNSSG
jgi:hypothetical protein